MRVNCHGDGSCDTQTCHVVHRFTVNVFYFHAYMYLAKSLLVMATSWCQCGSLHMAPLRNRSRMYMWYDTIVSGKAPCISEFPSPSWIHVKISIFLQLTKLIALLTYLRRWVDSVHERHWLKIARPILSALCCKPSLNFRYQSDFFTFVDRRGTLLYHSLQATASC